MIKGLKIKFVCINMLIVTVMLAVIFGLVLRLTDRNMEMQGRRLLQSIHEDPAGRISLGEGRRNAFFVVTRDSRGGLTVSDNGTVSGDPETFLEIARQALGQEEWQGLLKEQDLIFSRRISPRGERIVFVDISAERVMMEHLMRTCLCIAVLSFGLFLILSILLAQWAVRPVEEAWNQQRQFVADASHELKTPLTVIMTNAELLKSREGSEAQNPFAHSILLMSRQMRGLVDGLLNLARVDNGAVRTAFEEVDLSELFTGAVLPFEPVYFENNLELSTDIRAGIRVRGSRAHLQQVMDILLDNGAKYAPAGSTVSIRLEKQGNHCLLTVSNPGEEISREDLKNIFRRFYRIDKARSMNGSYGLGLPIAEGIVKDHGGKIWAESRAGMVTFSVQLPLLRS